MAGGSASNDLMWHSRLWWKEWAWGVAWEDVVMRAWAVLVWAVVAALFVYQAGLNLAVYLSMPTVVVVSLEPNPFFRLPPLSVCPYPAYEPTKLRALGLNLSGHYKQFNDSYLTLRGISDDLMTNQLWQEASWDFSQVLMHTRSRREGLVSFHASDDEMPSTWQRSFSPLGPCFTFNPPIGETEVTLFFNTASAVQLCKITNERGEVHTYHGFEGDCGKVEVACNSSCGMENYIFFRMAKLKKIFIYYHEMSVYSDHPPAHENDTLSYSKKLFDGNYNLKELSQFTSILVTPQLIESSLIKGWCNPDPSYSYGQCFRELHQARVLEDLGCSPMYPSTFHQPSGKVCRSPNTLNKVFYTEALNNFRCKQRCKRQMWNYDFKDYYAHTFATTMLAKTTDLKRIVEVETYPLTRLLCDTGGSLGLFLGASILTLIDLIAISLTNLCGQRNSKTQQHVVTTLRCGSMLIMGVLSATNILDMLRVYLFQPRLTAVSLRVGMPEPATEAALVTQRLAARTLDCRMHETRNEECRARCLLKLAANDITSVSPFTNLEGLPVCQAAGLSLPSLLYVVPSEMLLVATQREKVDTCRQKCGIPQHNNNTHVAGLVMTIYKDHYNYDSIHLICGICGIIGLYFGYSIFDALKLPNTLQVPKTRMVSNELSTNPSHKVRGVLKVGVVVVGMVLALWQFHSFLFYHKMSSSTRNVWHDNRTEQLAITVCRWPPLSLDHVAAQLDLNISRRLLYRLPQEERMSEVLRTLDNLPGNWSLTLEEVWQTAAWNITDVVEGFQAELKDGHIFTFLCDSNPYCAEVWRPVMTPLNRCFSLNASLFDIDITEITLVFPKVLEKKEILGSSPQLYFSITPVTEQVLTDDLVPKTAYHRILATHHQSQYRRLGSKGTAGSDTFSSCVHSCLSEAASFTLNCRLPYVQWRPDLPSCDQDQYTAIPRYFKGLEGMGRTWHDLKNSENISRAMVEKHDGCYRDCRHLQHTFTSISVDTRHDSFPEIVVRLPQDEDVLVQEEDLYTKSQLLSDVGSIASSTAGLSLIFLLKKLLPQILIHNND